MPMHASTQKHFHLDWADKHAPCRSCTPMPLTHGNGYDGSSQGGSLNTLTWKNAKR